MILSKNKRSGTVVLMALAFVFLFQTCLAAAATSTVNVVSQEVQLVFDGKTLVIPQGQYIFAIKGTNYVPLRFFSYALQKNVKWDSKTGTVNVTEPSKNEAMILNEYLVNSTGKAGQASAKGGTKVTVAPIQAKFNFGGTVKPIPSGQSAYSLSGTIYVPVRFMSQSVGIEIKWNKGGKIQAESPAYKTEQGSGNTGTEGGTTTTPGKEVEPSKDKDPAVVTPGGGGAGAGGKPTYESITSSTESSLTTLEQSCETQGFQLLLTADLSDKITVKKQFNDILAQCTTQFNQIVASAEQQLTANGYSTSIIADYRKAFQDKQNEGKATLDALIKK